MKKSYLFILSLVLFIAASCGKYSNPLEMSDSEIPVSYYSVESEIIVPSGTISQTITMHAAPSGLSTTLVWDQPLTLEEIRDGVRYHVYRSSSAIPIYQKIGETSNTFFTDEAPDQWNTYLSVKGIYKEYALTFTNFVEVGVKETSEEIIIKDKVMEGDIHEDIPDDIVDIIIQLDFQPPNEI